MSSPHQYGSKYELTFAIIPRGRFYYYEKVIQPQVFNTEYAKLRRARQLPLMLRIACLALTLEQVLHTIFKVLLTKWQSGSLHLHAMEGH